MLFNLTYLLKKIFYKVRKSLFYIRPSIKISYKWYGNKYGGFFVCPKYLNENSIVYSFGIGEDISFDKSIVNEHNSQVFCFDPTPKSISWIKNQTLDKNILFFEFGISKQNEIVDFYLPKNSNYVSGSLICQSNVDQNNCISVEMKSLKSIMDDLGHNIIDVLKMDIEGSEYDVIDYILESNIVIKQLLVEFHDRYLHDGVSKTKESIAKLSSHGFKVFAISDSLQEISFINSRI